VRPELGCSAAAAGASGLLMAKGLQRSRACIELAAVGGCVRRCCSDCSCWSARAGQERWGLGLIDHACAGAAGSVVCCGGG
jgi:hypothetical protein